MARALIATGSLDGILQCMACHLFGADSSITSAVEAPGPTWLWLSVAIATSAALVGCKKSEPDVVGFGLYEIGKSTPADGLICRPDGKQTYCFNNPSPSIAGHKTQTDLYFDGHADDAPLVEILVGIWACKPGSVSADLQAKMGEPTKVGDKRAMWHMKKMTIVAQLPKSDALCTVHFLDPKDTARADEIFAE